MTWVAVASYALAALGYGSTVVILFASRPRPGFALPLIAALTVSALWGATTALLVATDRLLLLFASGVDAAHIFAWTACVLSWLPASRVRRGLIWASATTGLWAVVASWLSGPLEWTVYPALVVMTLIGLLAIEQVFRNADVEERKALRLLCFGVGGIVVVDLFVYSQAALLGAPVALFWAGRGLANLLLLPLVVGAIKKQLSGELAFFISRQVVFHTASVLGVGGYLVWLGLVAYVVRAVGGEWTFVIELQSLLLAFGLLAFVLYSAALRRRLRTFLVKHFYRNKYDYRREWLRLTESLTRSGELGLLATSGLEALAQIVGARRGDLWLARDAGHYEWMASLGGTGTAQRTFDGQHAMVRFLAERWWVIDAEEYALAPDRYEMAFGDPAATLLPPRSIIVPLDCHGYLQGFVALEKRDEASALNFEDHDILKTAGKQVAIALAQAQTLEKLAETRQFEAMNKMSTFLMHDLKNIIAQQQLVVSNAARFKGRPEFFDDAIATVRSGVERMRHVLEQLTGPRVSGVIGRTNVTTVLMEVRSQCADRAPIPSVIRGAETLWVYMERAKLVSVLTHLVRNSQDATSDDGTIRVEVTVIGREVVLTVTDTGCGMSQEFIRDRLFRPFDSTKGAQGMGIGAYQVRDIVRGAGGEVDVTSTPNVGTTFKVRLPLAESSECAGTVIRAP